MKETKTHIRFEKWMTSGRNPDRESVCTTPYKWDDYVFVEPEKATCGSCLRIWLWEAWMAGKLRRA